MRIWRGVAVLVLGLIPGVASAQKFGDVATQLDRADREGAFRQAQTAPTRIQVAYRLQWSAGQAGDIASQADAIVKMHQGLYDLAAHECDHLRALAVGSCRLVSMNVDDRSQGYGAGSNTPTVSTATAVFEVMPLAAGAPPPPPPPNP